MRRTLPPAHPCPPPRAEAPPRRSVARGFTLIEVIVVLVLVSVLASVAIPRLATGVAVARAGWRDQVVQALWQARAFANGHRRVVCVAVATGSVTLTVQPFFDGGACTLPMASPDGAAAWAHDDAGATITATVGTWYFQPDGRITSDLAGASPIDGTIAIAGESVITVTGRTGAVQ